MIRMFGPLRILVAAVPMLIWRTICDFNMISVVDREMYFMVDAYAYCALLALPIYGFYEMGPWMNSGWTIRVLPGTRVLQIL